MYRVLGVLIIANKCSEKLLHAILEVTWLTESSCLMQYPHLDLFLKGRCLTDGYCVQNQS